MYVLEQVSEEHGCLEVPGWPLVKAKVLRLAAVSEVFVANRTWAEATFVQILESIFETVRAESHRAPPDTLDINACPLGLRMLKIICVMSNAIICPVAPTLAPEEMELLQNRPVPLLQMVTSGWPLFYFIHAHIQGRILPEKAITLDEGCEELETYATSHYEPKSLLHPAAFTKFLQNHLGARPSRLRMPAEPVASFRELAGKFKCQLATSTGEIAAALVSLSSVTSLRDTMAPASFLRVAQEATSLVLRADKRLKQWWSDWVAQKPCASSSEQRKSGFNAALCLVQLQEHCLRRWPIFGMLQRVQDLLFLQYRSRHMQSVGRGVDWGPAPRGLLARKGPKFWEERRRQLAAAVLGGAAMSTRARRKRAEPVLKWLGRASAFVTWNLGRLNSTAFLSRPTRKDKTPRSRRGVVIFQSGHEGSEYFRKGPRDPHGYAAHFTRMGFDVITLCMPFFGFNAYSGNVFEDDETEDPALYTSPHEVFDYWERKRRPALLSYFLLPVLLAIDWAQASLGHTEFAMVGCSGGGWTTTLAAAIDPRISLSISIPASLPPNLMDTLDWYPLDWEAQMNPQSVYETCSYICMYVLSSIGGQGPRRSVHLLHKNERHPNPSPNNVEGYEKELASFYEDYLPPILAAAAGNRKEPLEDAQASAVLAQGAPVRLAVTAARTHCGDQHDSAMLEILFERWHTSRKLGGADLFHEWPLPSDARHTSQT